jgi:hypothetical protein
VSEDVSCDIVKTWRAEEIAKMLGGKISWPWGKAVCQSKLEVARASLAKAMSGRYGYWISNGLRVTTQELPNISDMPDMSGANQFHAWLLAVDELDSAASRRGP